MQSFFCYHGGEMVGKKLKNMATISSTGVAGKTGQNPDNNNNRDAVINLFNILRHVDV